MKRRALVFLLLLFLLAAGTVCMIAEAKNGLKNTVDRKTLYAGDESVLQGFAFHYADAGSITGIVTVSFDEDGVHSLLNPAAAAAWPQMADPRILSESEAKKYVHLEDGAEYEISLQEEEDFSLLQVSRFGLYERKIYLITGDEGTENIREIPVGKLCEEEWQCLPMIRNSRADVFFDGERLIFIRLRYAEYLSADPSFHISVYGKDGLLYLADYTDSLGETNDRIESALRNWETEDNWYFNFDKGVRLRSYHFYPSVGQLTGSFTK